MELHDNIKCPACEEITPLINGHCIYCHTMLVEEEPRIIRRFKVRIRLLSRTPGELTAIARVNYFGVWLVCYVFDDGQPDDPFVELPKVHPEGSSKPIRSFYLEDRGDLADLIDSVREEYFKAIGTIREERPVLVGNEEWE